MTTRRELKEEPTMSYLETGKSRFRWLQAALKTSHRRTPGCVQCGSRLEVVEFGAANLTGKCFNCTNWISDEDEEFEELDD
jgi:hypothetical protein